jgi:hypothetical protein
MSQEISNNNFSIIKQQLILDANNAVNKMREEGKPLTILSVMVIINEGVAKFVNNCGRRPNINEINDIYYDFMYPQKT